MKVWRDRLLIIIVFVAAWQLATFASEVAISSPLSTLTKISTLLSSTSFWPHAKETALAFLYALGIAVVSGLAAGLAIGFSKLATEVFEPVLIAIYGIPKVMFYPIILLVFGLGFSAKVAFGTLHAFFPVAIFTINGLRNQRSIYRRAAKTMRLGPLQTTFTVLLPAAMPEIVTGIRLGSSLTMLGVLIGEMFSSQRGLGFLIMNAIGVQDVETMFAVILMLAIVAIAFNMPLLWLDQRLQRRVNPA